MAEYLQIHNPRHQRSIEEILSDEVLPIAGFGPPLPPKNGYISPEDLIDSGVSVTCSMRPIRWGQSINRELISEKIFQEIYAHRINNLGLNIENVNDEQWQALSKVSFPVSHLNSREQEVLDDYLKLLIDKAITISATVFITWLILRGQGKKAINYTFNSEGGDIVLGTADFSTNIYLSFDKQVHIANDILDDRKITPEVSHHEPPINILKRPVLFINNGENGFIPVPLTAGYFSKDSATSNIKPLRRSGKLLERLFSLFRKRSKSTLQPAEKHPASVFNGLPLEKNPEILEVNFQYSKDEKIYSPPKCLLVIQERPYLIINNKRIYISTNTAIAIRECINLSESKADILIDNNSVNSELGAAYLNGVKRKKWEKWLKKVLSSGGKINKEDAG